MLDIIDKDVQREEINDVKKVDSSKLDEEYVLIKSEEKKEEKKEGKQKGSDFS